MRTRTTGSAYVAEKKGGKMLNRVIALMKRELGLQPVAQFPVEVFPEGRGLPVVPIDEDFLEYLEEMSVDVPIDESELFEYWTEWERENT